MIRRALPQQRGAATLVIVMVLFLVMALLAAYANRSLLFEQRIANSYYRASVAQEMAEAGIEWSIAQLNGVGTNASCVPVATGGTRFASRYLAISAEDRGISQAAPTGVTSMVADCMKTSTGWSCRCPALGSWTPPAAATGTDLVPSFGLYIPPLTTVGGAIKIRSVGCTNSVASTCSSGEVNGRAGQGASQQDATVALVSAVRSPPAAPLIVKGNVTVTGTGLGLRNTDPRSAGLLYDVGGAVTGFNDTRLSSVPGTSPAMARVAGDTTLTGADVFRMFMGSTATRYRDHPALRDVTCDSDCGATLAAAYSSGRRMVWIEGNMASSSTQTLGSLTDPMVVVVNGDATLSGAFQLYGLLVVRGNLSWTTSAGTSQIVGAVVVEGNLSTSGAMDIVYLTSMANQLRNRVGSFVRVPAGWTDLR